MEILRWLLGGILLSLGFWISAFGIVRVFINTRLHDRGLNRHVSGLPILGPVIFIAGWLVSPLAWSWWVLLIIGLDLDTLLLLMLPFVRSRP